MQLFLIWGTTDAGETLIHGGVRIPAYWGNNHVVPAARGKEKRRREEVRSSGAKFFWLIWMRDSAAAGGSGGGGCSVPGYRVPVHLSAGLDFQYEF